MTTAAITAEHAAFQDGQSDGYADGRMDHYQPTFSNPGLQAMSRNDALASAYGDGYWSGWMSGQDARDKNGEM
jgi:hypothetical protein